MVGMEQLNRNFVARVMGRGTVSVVLADGGSAEIVIAFYDDDHVARTVTLNADAEGIASLRLSLQDLLFLLCRVAITQTQSALIARTAEGVTFTTLNLSLTPWNGDLTLTPFGGPTSGCERLFRSIGDSTA